MEYYSMRLKVNGEEHRLEIEPCITLCELLRENLELTGTKVGCATGTCGVCTVLVDGQSVKSCLILAPQVDGKEITTIEGLEGEGELHPLQKAFIEKGAIACGFCTPGMILSAKALLDENPHPSEEEIRDASAGNFCRCTGYVQVVEAIKHAAKGGNSER